MGGPMVGDGADDERDRQATVTDFLDYTEHLPADIERSLTLLREQDELAQGATEQLHRLLQQYAQLAPDHDAYESAQMRKEIAYLLDLIRRRRESSAAEAHRLNDEAVRHHKRLQNVKAKLLALPQPPSRDPTPQPTQKSPQARRNESIRLSLKAADSHMRSALPKRRMIVPGEVLPPWNPDSQASSDYDDDAEEELAAREEMITLSPVVSRKKKEKPFKKPKKPKEPKMPKEPKPKKDKLPRLPGQVGTNVHSSVAGISTSNALSLLTPPPDNARPGSKFAPWFRLTEWEMATLRKRMKKNAIWAPSDTMIRRELVDKGRGHEAYQRAKRHHNETGEPMLDEDDVEGQLNGQRELRPGEISADTKTKTIVTLNKGMDLNVRKKEKKIMMAQQQAALAAQQNADMANQSLATLSQSFRTLFDRPPDAASPSTPGTDASTVRVGGGGGGGSGSSNSYKRKRDSGISPSAQDLQLQAQLLAEGGGGGGSGGGAGGGGGSSSAGVTPAKPTPKKFKGLPTILPATPKVVTTTTTTTVPTAPPAASPVKQSTTTGAGTKTEPGTEAAAASSTAGGTSGTKKSSTTTNHAGRRMSLTLHMPRTDSKTGGGGGGGVEPNTGRETRQSSRPSSARASAGPMDANFTITTTNNNNSNSLTRQSPRLKSATPGPTPTGPNSSTNPFSSSTGTSTSTSGPHHHQQQQTTAGAQRERRSKRPAPGPVSSAYPDGSGGPVVASGRRKNAPKKKGKLNVEEGRKQEEWLDEEVDPNEPRYCVCNNVSYGTMIQCENAQCEGGEWFHLECVKLKEPPGRRDKWWCPRCRA